MDSISRITGLTLAFGLVGAGIGAAVMHQYSDANVAGLFVGCVGAVIGAIAGATREITAAQRRNPGEGSTTSRH